MISKSANRKLAPLYRQLGPDFQSFVLRGTSLLQAPVDLLLGGFNFYPTVIDENYRWLAYFVQPLFVPKDFVALSFGDRFPAMKPPGNGPDLVYVGTQDKQLLNLTAQILKEEGLKKLAPMITLEGFYRYLQNSNLKDIYVLEALASTAILLDRFEEATGWLENAINWHIVMFGDAEVNNAQLRPFESELLKRIVLMKEIAEAADWPAAKTQLSTWTQYTSDSLRVGDLRSGSPRK